MTGRPRRQRLGQHFLVDRGVARAIVGLLAEEPSRVVEIGPGRGALTEPLLARFDRVLALELDPTLAGELAARLGSTRVEVQQADALTVPFAPLLGPEAPWQLAANLPYSVGTAILRRLLPLSGLLTRLVVMLQEEVAARVVAPPGRRDHGLLALERAAFAEARVAFTVGPGAFRPRPRVSSAVLVLELRPPAHDPCHLARALELAGCALTHPRKMLHNAIGDAAPRPALEAAGLDPETRPATVSLEGWARLAAEVDRGP
jgi:16S rRNA (adenine1518-N6/adenine1519-N6)-dimethyltransferase